MSPSSRPAGVAVGGVARRIASHRGRTRGAGVLAVAAGLLAGLASVPSPAAFEVVDLRGHTVRLATPPRRIVCLVPSAAEWIFALGGGDRLVGVTDYCDWPPEVRSKVRVGGMLAPSLETIVALHPDVVVATDDGNRAETVEQLGRLRIPVFVVHARSLAEVTEVVRRLGTLTSRAPAVEPRLAEFHRRLGAVAGAVAGRPRPRVLYVLWPEPLIVPGRHALVTELIELAGGASVTAALPADYPRWSLEAAVASPPDVIVLARHGTGAPPLSRARWDRLGELPAVRAGRVWSVDGNLLHRYGPRLVEGLEALARVLHPEAFR